MSDKMGDMEFLAKTTDLSVVVDFEDIQNLLMVFGKKIDELEKQIKELKSDDNFRCSNCLLVKSDCAC